MLQGRGTPSLKPRDRANAACTAQLAVRTRGAAASLVPGRRRRRRPPRGAAVRALDAGRLAHTHGRPAGVRTHEPQSPEPSAGAARLVPGRRRRQPPRGIAVGARARTLLCAGPAGPREQAKDARERRTREPQTNPNLPNAAAHSVKQEPQEARLRVGGPRPHRQAPQASWGKR